MMNNKENMKLVSLSKNNDKMQVDIKNKKEIKKEQKYLKETREIYPGVRVKVKDAQRFVNDMMKGDNPIWDWIVRIGVLSANAFVIFLIVKGGL